MLATAHDLAQQQGYTLNSSDIIQNPGRLEGQHVSILYWESAWLDGFADDSEENTDSFDITDKDRTECPGIPTDAKTARLTHSDSGFLTLSYHHEPTP